MKNLFNNVANFYNLGGEAERLFNSPEGIVERLRTEIIIKKYIPAAPAVIYDIGGGAGVYAFPLARSGYKVHLIDLTPLHIEQARSVARTSGIALAEYSVGNAVALDVPDSVADAVLLLGPLYHLQDKQDRLKALQEAYRILKPGGVLCAAAIARFSAFSAVASRNLLTQPHIASMIETGIKTGIHENPTSDPWFFTSAFYHLPEQLEQEVIEVHFKKCRIVAIEGLSFLFTALHETANNPEALEKLLYMLQLTENEKSIVGASSHIMAIAHK